MPIKPIRYKGEIFRSRSALAGRLGVCVDTLAKWLNNAKDDKSDRVIDARLTSAHNRPQPICFSGVEYKSISRLAESLGVASETVLSWIRTIPPGEREETIQRNLEVFAGKTWKNGYPKQIVYKGRHFSSHSALATHLNVSCDTLGKWLKGVDPSTIEKVIDEHLRALDRSVVYQGAAYPSMNQLSREIGVNASTLLSWRKKGLPLEEGVRLLTHVPVQQKSAVRRSQIDWNNSTVDEVASKWAGRHTKLSNLDFTNAYRIPGRLQQITGIVCKLHGPIRELKQMGRLKEGAQPCKECEKRMRRKPEAKYPRTMERARIIVTQLGLEIDLRTAKLEKGNVRKQGGRDLKLVGAVCSRHNLIIAPTWWNHFAHGRIGCSNCFSGQYTEAEMREKIARTHSGTIQLVRYSGAVLKPSDYRCNLCCHEWSAAINGLLGGKNRRPTGCPVCSRPGSRERVIRLILDEKKVPYRPQYEIRVNGFRRPLKSDYYLPKHNLTIEYDGEQHYVQRAFGGDQARAEDQFRQNQLRDLAKRNALRDRGIRTTRIPFWVQDLKGEVEKILSGEPSFPDLPNPENYRDHERFRKLEDCL